MFKRIPFYVILRLSERCPKTRSKEHLNYFNRNTFVNNKRDFRICSTDATVQQPTNFIQQQPILSNQYLKDPLLRPFLKQEVPSAVGIYFDIMTINFYT